MNTHLRTVKMQVKGQEKIAVDHITIRGNNIRYFILPDALPIESLLVEDQPKIKKKTITKIKQKVKPNAKPARKPLF